MISIKKPVILASRSPRRIHLLSLLGIPFSVQESGVEEIHENGSSPEDLVQRLSLRKANEVAACLPSGIVIGADTVVVLNGEILGKPSSSDDAVAMLSKLSGKTHAVYTGFALVDAETKESYIDFEKTEVTFRPLAAEEIDRYVHSGAPMDKAGAYGIQDDYGAVFVARIDGCFYNVVGFPLSKFYSAFIRFVEQRG